MTVESLSELLSAALVDGFGRSSSFAVSGEYSRSNSTPCIVVGVRAFPEAASSTLPLLRLVLLSFSSMLLPCRAFASSAGTPPGDGKAILSSSPSEADLNASCLVCDSSSFEGATLVFVCLLWLFEGAGSGVTGGEVMLRSFRTFSGRDGMGTGSGAGTKFSRSGASKRRMPMKTTATVATETDNTASLLPRRRANGLNRRFLSNVAGVSFA